jgi:hypothetical protein
LIAAVLPLRRFGAVISRCEQKQKAGQRKKAENETLQA